MNQNNEHKETASKKAQVLGADKTSNRKNLYTIVTVVVALLAVAAIASVVLIYTGDGFENRASSQKVASLPGVGPVITFDASQFQDGKARHYMHKTSDGVEIIFFILKSSDGVIRAAFDACDVCWRSGKGYAQDGDVMVCRNCGRRFPSVSVNEIKGGCNPAPLRRRMENGKVIIRVADIENDGRRFFNFGSSGSTGRNLEDKS